MWQVNNRGKNPTGQLCNNIINSFECFTTLKITIKLKKPVVKTLIIECIPERTGCLIDFQSEKTNYLLFCTLLLAMA